MTRYQHNTSAAAAAAADHSSAPASSTSEPHPSRHSPLQPAAVPRDDELRDAFQVFDKDKDGFLSATDLRLAYSQYSFFTQRKLDKYYQEAQLR